MIENDLKRAYGETIFNRGEGYFDDGRVTRVIKFRGKLIGEVIGTEKYTAEVDLSHMGCRCSCPYGTNCKHGVAVSLHYFNEDYIDGDAIINRMKDMGRDELLEVIDKLISIDPAILSYLEFYQADETKSSENRVKTLDKEILSRMQNLLYSNADYNDVEELAKFIKVNEDILTKKHIFYILEFLVRNCEEYGFFYDDYSDNYFGDVIFQSLCDAFVIKDLEVGDFQKLTELQDIDYDYDMLNPFFVWMAETKNAAKLADFEEYFQKYLNEYLYCQFLINSGLSEKARNLIEKGGSMHEENRFYLYQQVDRDAAIEFALENGFYSSLFRYYHETGAHDKIVELFKEVVADKGKMSQLADTYYLYRDILDSICKSDMTDGLDEVLRSLYNLCYVLKYYGHCVDAGIEIGDKELMHDLIDKRIQPYFNVESKMKLLEYLIDEYKDEVRGELMSFARSLIDEMNNDAYEKAADCVFLLREIVGKDEWEKYVKGLYLGHFRKINLWREFGERGIHMKKKENVVTLSDRR